MQESLEKKLIELSKNVYVEYVFHIIGTLLVAWLLAFALRRALTYFITKSKRSTSTPIDTTNLIFLKNSINFITLGIAILWIISKIPYFKSLGTAIFASAGVLAAIFGFASQKAFANIIGGLFILTFKPFRVNDAVQLSNGRRGSVEEITLRHTVIRDYENQRIIIPNSIMSEDTIINSSITERKIKRHIEFGIAYDADLNKAEQIIRQAITEHPNFLDNRTAAEKRHKAPAVVVKLVRWEEFSLILKAFVWAKDFDSAVALEWDVLRSVKLAFDKEGIEIPYPYRTLVYKNDIGPNTTATDVHTNNNELT